jgi:hypothetical protein
MTAPRNDQHQFKSILAKPAPSTHDSTSLAITDLILKVNSQTKDMLDRQAVFTLG